MKLETLQPSNFNKTKPHFESILRQKAHEYMDVLLNRMRYNTDVHQKGRNLWYIFSPHMK